MSKHYKNGQCSEIRRSDKSTYSKCPNCDCIFHKCRIARKTCSKKCGQVIRAKKMIGHRPFNNVSGEKNPKWGGGLHIDKDGYKLVYCPKHPNRVLGCYIREHRLIMEKHLGRFLNRGEIVHHKNGNKQDNRIENLELMKKTEHDRHSILSRRRDNYGRVL